MNDKLIDDWVDSFEERESGCLKSSYRHFDPKVSKDMYIIGGRRRKDLLFSADLTKYKFWPLIRFDQKKRHYFKNISGEREIKRKNRPIMYPAHRDSCIMSFYAFLLKKNYESIIRSSRLNDSVLGYRKIPVSLSTKKNKSNINFANDIYAILKTLSGYTVLCIDIKGFFDNIHHALLRGALKPFLNGIPETNLNFIIKNVTDYRYVFAKDAKNILGDKSWINPRKYNELIRDSALVHKNKKARGIPQGTPISDILSNIYLYEFDLAVMSEISKMDKYAAYRRYCDDILIIVPKENAKEVYGFIINEIKKYKLQVGENKTEAFYVDSSKGIFKDITNNFVSGYNRRKEFLQYLGFYMNLDSIIIRSGTIAKRYRSVRRIKGTRRNLDGSINKRPLDTYEKLSGLIIKDKSMDRQYSTIRRHIKSILRTGAGTHRN